MRNRFIIYWNSFQETRALERWDLRF